MKVCIVLNGEVKNYSKTKEIIVTENYDYIIAADGGCKHLYKMNITPDYIIGDLDSVDEEVISYYKSKNVIFDDTCGGTEECTEEEYLNAAKKYIEVMK